MESVVDRREGGWEPLRRCLGLELPHLPLTPSDQQMAVPSTVVLLRSARPAQATQTQFLQRCGIGSEAVMTSGSTGRLRTSRRIAI
jgi:hypothetical protein